MYNQEVHDIIEKLKEHVKDPSLEDDLHMLSLYSEMRSNALSDHEQKEHYYKRQINAMGDSLDSADAMFDMMDMVNLNLRQRLKHSKTSSADASRYSIDDDED